MTVRQAENVGAASAAIFAVVAIIGATANWLSWNTRKTGASWHKHR